MDTTRSKNPNALLGTVSFLLPVVGWILGIIFVTKDDTEDKRTGKICLLASFAWLVGAITVFLLYFVVAIAMRISEPEALVFPGVLILLAVFLWKYSAVRSG